MATTSISLTHDRLKELLLYDPETGLFYWRVSRGGARPGSVAGCKPRPDGYRVLRIDGVLHFQHRLAWLYVHGRWPEALIDHANRIVGDNRLANLREASASENHANSTVRSHNKSGFKGVSRNPPGWMARIKVCGKTTHLGTFPTPEEAHAVYAAAASQVYGMFGRAR